MSEVLLVPCDATGAPARPLRCTPDLTEAFTGTAALYRNLGFTPPWVGYAAAIGDEAVGGGAFVGAPVAGEVEIAYFTSPAHQGRGVATAIARGLVALAHAEDPTVTVVAMTLPEPNPSTRILERLGFARVGTVTDADIGDAWKWSLQPALLR